jgi:hypothetical protein
MDAIVKKYPTIGVCGLDCGLCPRHYTEGRSRCPGCAGPGFSDKHPSCSFITCCVKKKHLEACGQCPDFPCAKFKSEEEYRQVKELSSYPPYRKVMPNLNFIREHGIERFAGQQRQRIKLLQRMLGNFNDGRSRSHYCRAAALLDPADLERALVEATQRIKADHIEPNDAKAKAKILRLLLDDLASNQGLTRR